jgi:homopolymeric O-antigen transport system ATP-binding protein
VTNDVVLRVEALSKQYRMGARREPYRTMRDTLAMAATAPLRWVRGSQPPRRDADTFWALKDVSFDVRRGDVVGVVGRNGAGKSTLLKVLSRITEPTTGFADVTGRVGALLEVGTGFHQELTGRENIFLNAAILGMSKSDVDRKFDAIVDFAEVAPFIDTAVKHYSSGMYLRLAFAVAAFLQPDILLIDEVLAVGDAAFQAKCLGKMGEVASEGRTVLFVSHNMSAITELCTRAVLLDGGRLTFEGTPARCVAEYLHGLEQEPESGEPEPGGCTLGTVRVNGGTTAAIASGRPFTVTVALHARHANNPWIFFVIEDATGRSVVHSRVLAADIGPRVLDGRCELRAALPALWLSPGVYSMYFKVLTAGPAGSSGRVHSPRLALEVRGEAEHTGKAVLNPAVAWSAAAAPAAMSVLERATGVQ